MKHIQFTADIGKGRTSRHAFVLVVTPTERGYPLSTAFLRASSDGLRLGTAIVAASVRAAIDPFYVVENVPDDLMHRVERVTQEHYRRRRRHTAA